MRKKGKVAILNNPGGNFDFVEFQLPDPAPGTMIIKQEMTGVCGTDIHMYYGRLPGTIYPVALGHEFVGTVEALGKGVKTDFLGRSLKEGDRVFVKPGVSCGKCYWCAVAKTPCTCSSGFAYGFLSAEEYPFSGGYSEYIYLHHPRTCAIKTNLPAEVAALAEPISVGVHAVNRAKIKLGDTVVIQGSGAIGLAAQACAKMAGAGKIIHVGGPTDFRIKMAEEFGADVTINITKIKDPHQRVEIVKENTITGIGADVVFECAGVPQAISEGLNMLRTGGTFVEVGHFTNVGEATINPFVHFCNKNVNIQGCWGSEAGHFVKELPILENRLFPFERLITHKVSLERLPEIMNVPQSGYFLDGKESLKIVVES